MKIFYLLAQHAMQANLLQYKVLHRHIVFQNTGNMTLCSEKNWVKKWNVSLIVGIVACMYTIFSEHNQGTSAP